MLDGLNELAQGTKPAEGGGFQHHPFGEFNAQIGSVIQKTTEKGKPLWEVGLISDVARDKHTIWDFTPEDVDKAKTDPDHRVKVMKAIARTKKLFVDLGVWDEAIAEKAGWDGPSPSVDADIGSLTGKRCWIKVERSNRNPKDIVIWVNAPRDNQPDRPAAIASSGNGSADMGSEPPQDFGAPPDTPSLDEIPF